MEAIWVVISTALLVFCFRVSLKWVYSKGYKAGAESVIKVWKQTIIDAGEMKND